MKPQRLNTNFNPHSREGSDAMANGYKENLTIISIHTPAKGVTIAVHKQLLDTLISIHTPAKGVTNNLPLSIFLFFISIHTPAKGVTVVCTNLDKYYYCISIHTPAKGVTGAWIPD